MRKTSGNGQMCGRNWIRTQKQRQTAMHEVHDEKLSQLVSLGGWLRGHGSIDLVVKQHFPKNGD